MASHDTDDDDPVVAEYTVYSSQRLAGRLHLFQYPLRDADRHYELSSRSLTVTRGVADKPQTTPASLPGPTSRFQMKMRLDISSSDSFKGHRRSHSASGGGGGGGGGMESPANSLDLLDRAQENAAAIGNGDDDDEEQPGVYKYTLESQPATLRSSYAAALFVRDEVHITSINSVQQFGPKLRSNSDDGFLSSLRADTSTSSAMQSHLERQLHRLRSVVLEEDARTAVPVDLYESYSVESETVARQFLYQGGAGPSASFGALDASGRPAFRPLPDALAHYFPIESCGARDESFRRSRTTVLRYAHFTHSINDQVKALLQSAVLLTVGQACEVVRTLDGPQPSTDSRGFQSQIVQALKNYAVYMHGAWVASYDTTFRGSQAFIRESVLLTFATSTDGSVTFEEAAAPIRGHVFHERTVRSILESVSTLDRATRRWVLTGSAGGTHHQAMLQHFPEEVDAQRSQWGRSSVDILRNIETVVNGRPPNNHHLKLPRRPQPGAQPTPTGMRSHSAPVPAAAAAGGSSTPVAAAPAAMTPVEEATHRAHAVRFIRLTLEMHGVVSSQLMRDHIRASLEKPTCIMYRCPAQLVQDAAKSTLQTFTTGTWILKSVDPATDVYRASLIHAMREKPSFTAKEIVADAEKILNSDSPAQARTIPTSVTSSVLVELAEYRAAEKLYHVKTGRVTFAAAPPGTTTTAP